MVNVRIFMNINSFTEIRHLVSNSKELTVGGDVNLLWKLCYVDLEAVLDIIQGLRISLIRNKCYGQAFGPKPSSTGHLR